MPNRDVFSRISSRQVCHKWNGWRKGRTNRRHLFEWRLCVCVCRSALSSEFGLLFTCPVFAVSSASSTATKNVTAWLVYKTTCHFSIHCVRAPNSTMTTVKPGRKNCAMGICHFHCWVSAFSFQVCLTFDGVQLFAQSLSAQKTRPAWMAALAGANVRVARELLISIVCIHSTWTIRYHLMWMRFAVCCSVRRAHYSTSFSLCHLLSLDVFATHFYTCNSVVPTFAQLFGPLLHIVRTQESVFGSTAASDCFSEPTKKRRDFNVPPTGGLVPLRCKS